MELSINGHKVVGHSTLRNGTVDYTNFNSSSSCIFVVVNGICCVRLYITPKTAFTDAKVFATGLPPTYGFSLQMTIGTSTLGTSSRTVTIDGNGIAKVAGGNTTSESYCTVSYPVADSWHE